MGMKNIKRFSYRAQGGFFFNNEEMQEDRIYTDLELIMEKHKLDSTINYIKHIKELPLGFSVYEHEGILSKINLETVGIHFMVEEGIGTSRNRDMSSRFFKVTNGTPDPHEQIQFFK